MKRQVVKDDNNPVAVIMGDKEYLRLKEIEEDRIDYYSALQVKKQNKKSKNHDELKKKLGLSFFEVRAICKPTSDEE